MNKRELSKRLDSIQGELQAPMDALQTLAGEIEEHIDSMSDNWRDGDAGCAWSALMEQCHVLASEIEGGFPDSSEV